MTFEPVPTAPRALVELHSQIRVGRDLLGALLASPKMRRPWRELARRIERPTEWRELWGEIRYALRCARKPTPSRRTKRRRFEKIAAVARELAQRIGNGPLDLRAYEYFAADDWAILGIEDWPTLDSLARSDAAHRVLTHWPSMVELLRTMEKRARSLAIEATTEPRPVERKRRAAEVNAMTRTICGYLVRRYGSPMYGTVAAIASIALGERVPKETVAQIYRRYVQKGRH